MDTTFITDKLRWLIRKGLRHLWQRFTGRGNQWSWLTGTEGAVYSKVVVMGLWTAVQNCRHQSETLWMNGWFFWCFQSFVCLLIDTKYPVVWQESILQRLETEEKTWEEKLQASQSELQKVRRLVNTAKIQIHLIVNTDWIQIHLMVHTAKIQVHLIVNTD